MSDPNSNDRMMEEESKQGSGDETVLEREETALPYSQHLQKIREELMNKLQTNKLL